MDSSNVITLKAPPLGLQSIAALIDSKDVALLDSIQVEWFKSELEHDVAKFVREHAQKYGAYPARSTINAATADFEWPAVVEPLPFYREQMRERHIHQTTKQKIVDASKLLNSGQPYKAAELLASVETTVAADSASITWASSLMKPYTAPAYLVHGLLEQGTAVGLVAPFGAGKTFLALEIAACVATGESFHGRKVTKGLVVYLCGEGQNGIRHRLQALKYGRGIDTDKAPLAIFTEAVPLLSADGVEHVRQAIRAAEKQTGLKLTLLIVDTMSRYYGGEENSASDMNTFLNAVDELRGDGTSIVVHHTGHGDKTRGRGASAWDPALDTSIVITKDSTDDRLIEVSCLKQKDGEQFEPMRFRIVGGIKTDSAREDGSPINSAVLEPTDEIAVKPITGKNQAKLLAHLATTAKNTVLATWTEPELRKIAKDLGIGKSSAFAAVAGLIKDGQLVKNGPAYVVKDGPKVQIGPNGQIGQVDHLVQNVQNPLGVGHWTGLEPVTGTDVAVKL